MYCGVVDCGSYSTKLGFAGENIPRFTLRSNIAKVNSPSEIIFRVGNECLDLYDQYTEIESIFSTPEDYDFIGLIPFWKYILQDALRIDIKEIPIILSDSIFSTDSQREKLLEFLFESVGTPAVYLAKKPMLDAFSVGQSTALIFESGASMTTCVPVVDGYPLLKASQKSIFGGDYLDKLLYEKLKEAGTPIPTRYETQLRCLNKPIPTNIPESYRYYSSLNIAREMKESLFSVSLEPLDPFNILQLQQQQQQQNNNNNNNQNQSQNPLSNIKQEDEYKRYELPDGTTFNIGPYKNRLPELFFNPGNSDTSPSLTDLLYQSVYHCPPDLRKDMLGNIFVCGGNSKMKGFCERLSSEIIQKIPENHKVKFIAPDERQRTFATWLGGSILGSLGSFQQMWISKEEYKEKHSFSLLHRGP